MLRGMEFNRFISAQGEREVPSVLVDHTYIDYSAVDVSELLEEDDTRIPGGSRRVGSRGPPLDIAGLPPHQQQRQMTHEILSLIDSAVKLLLLLLRRLFCCGGGVESDSPHGRTLNDRVTFPMRLHMILSDPKNRNVVRWMPHGRSWKVLDKEGLERLCGEYFYNETFEDFIELVNMWGFKKLVGAGPDYRSYYHPKFLRGKFDVCRLMDTNVNTGRLIPNPVTEPNLYEISRLYPLPEDEVQANGQANQDTDDEDFAGSDTS